MYRPTNILLAPTHMLSLYQVPSLFTNKQTKKTKQIASKQSRQIPIPSTGTPSSQPSNQSTNQTPNIPRTRNHNPLKTALTDRAPTIARHATTTSRRRSHHPASSTRRPTRTPNRSHMAIQQGLIAAVPRRRSTATRWMGRRRRRASTSGAVRDKIIAIGIEAHFVTRTRTTSTITDSVMPAFGLVGRRG